MWWLLIPGAAAVLVLIDATLALGRGAAAYVAWRERWAPLGSPDSWPSTQWPNPYFDRLWLPDRLDPDPDRLRAKLLLRRFVLDCVGLVGLGGVAVVIHALAS
jgi:hypothetical protein